MTPVARKHDVSEMFRKYYLELFVFGILFTAAGLINGVLTLAVLSVLVLSLLSLTAGYLVRNYYVNGTFKHALCAVLTLCPFAVVVYVGVAVIITSIIGLDLTFAPFITYPTPLGWHFDAAQFLTGIALVCYADGGKEMIMRWYPASRAYA